MSRAVPSMWWPLCSRHLARRPVQARGYASSLFPRSQPAAASARASSRFSLPDKPARTRFAPSPTGYLHLGSLRTALFNYLLARATGGQFLIRVEDTDQTRLVKDAEARLYDDLAWAGLSWDEGPDVGGLYGPYRQSERLGLYRKHADRLLREGRAFRCFCSRESLELRQAVDESGGAAVYYPGTCLSMSEGESDDRAARGEPHTIRFKSAARPVEARDLVYGNYKKAEREDDFIIIKSDGFPTYHFANVIDDHLMEITHVIRGAEWLISTPKHVELYNAFGWNPPQFAHVGLLVDMKRQKLSKRDWANIGISSYRDQGVLPPALLNFVAMLGWNPNLKEIPVTAKGLLTVHDMIKHFSLRFTRGDIVVDMSKLAHLQAKHATLLLRQEPQSDYMLSTSMVRPIEQSARRLEELRQERRHAYSDTPSMGPDDPVSSLGACLLPLDSGRTQPYIRQTLASWKGSYQNPDQFVLDNRYLFWKIPKASLCESFGGLVPSIKSVSINGTPAEIAQTLSFFAQRLSTIDEARWTSRELGDVVKDLLESTSVVEAGKPGPVGGAYKLLRWALLSSMSGSQIVAVMEMLGKQETIQRLSEAADTATRA